VLCAASPLIAGVSGIYLDDCNEAPPLVPGSQSPGVAGYALDPGSAQRLWEVSMELIDKSGG
jgi:hypothetical protein